MSGDNWFVLIFGLAAGFMLGFIIGGTLSGVASQRDAVVSGHAEYVAKDGIVVWQWKPLEVQP